MRNNGLSDSRLSQTIVACFDVFRLYGYHIDMFRACKQGGLIPHPMMGGMVRNRHLTVFGITVSTCVSLN